MHKMHDMEHPYVNDGKYHHGNTRDEPKRKSRVVCYTILVYTLLVSAALSGFLGWYYTRNEPPTITHDIGEWFLCL